MKILIAEPLAEGAISLLRAQPGWDVVVSNPKEYEQHLADADALVVRSAVKVNAAVLSKAPRLRVIGRAGVGVDNVDMAAATAAGVLVMNTPGGNAIAVAEHTIGLMISLARYIPQASFSTKSGKWEKKKFVGSELRGKTLGVLGLGNIGREVVHRARGFEMRILGHDPYVNPSVAEEMGVELVDLERLYAESDYLTLHLAVTPETRNMIDARAFAQMKDGVRIINCARGELIVGNDLLAAMRSGKVAGAALDVFDVEPPDAGSELLKEENLIATPHIGGSTEEAQETVGIRIVQQMIEYLVNGVAVNAVNMPALSPEQYKTLGPWVDVAQRLGTFAAHVAEGHPKSVRLVYYGKIAETNTHLLRNAGLAGLLNRYLSQKANVVNAFQIATQRGLSVAEQHEPQKGPMDAIRLEVGTDTGVLAVEGALMFGKPRLTNVDGISLEAALDGHLTFMKNRDVPGVIGHVGTVLGRNEINIANFALGRQTGAPASGGPLGAVAVVETDCAVPEEVLAQLREHPAVLLARTVALTGS
jgi:D-3-phosphoglycerate dehydrogenase